jgi:polyisoprenoid-binding protein YceI
MAWIADPAHSAVEFSAKHMMISTVRGAFEKFTVTANVDEANIAQSSIDATVETASISTRDERRDGHLRSADFFDADNYPTLTFHSTKIEQKGTNKYAITGDLTIKDATHEVTFNVESEGRGKDPWGNEHWGFSGDATINRKDWGLNWNVALETGGWLVSDQIKIHIELELVPAPEAASVAAEAQAEAEVGA